MKSSACSSGFVSITMDPENYMVSNTRCCQSDACNHDPLPGKGQRSPTTGESLPAPPESLL